MYAPFLDRLLGPSRSDGLVDGSHPNDLGFQWMAEGLASRLRRMLAICVRPVENLWCRSSSVTGVRMPSVASFTFGAFRLASSSGFLLRFTAAAQEWSMPWFRFLGGQLLLYALNLVVHRLRSIHPRSESQAG